MQVGGFFPIARSGSIAAGAAPGAAESLDEAARGFEAVMARSLLHTLIEPAMEGGLLGEGPGKNVLSSMLEDSLAEEWARTGTLGIADSVRRSLAERTATDDAEQAEPRDEEEGGP